MLQIDMKTYASDALEDAMKLAQTKSLNSYTFSDCLSFLNYVWSDIYSQICLIDSGYYSKTVQLKAALTRLPKFVKNSIMVYRAQRPDDGSIRTIYRAANNAEMRNSGFYSISGNDLFCADAERSSSIWLEYCPQPQQIFFTHRNRDPKIITKDVDIERSNIFNIKMLFGDNDLNVSDVRVTSEDISASRHWYLRHRNSLANIPDDDITEFIIRPADENGEWQLKFITCDFPYIFCSYCHSVTGEWLSGFFDKNMEWTPYNPFAWTGRNDNVEYIRCNWNDKTGLGVVVRDWNDFTTKILNIEHLPELADTVIFVENSFEYKATNEAVYNFTQGYWFNRYSTDYNYEKVPILNSFPQSPDLGDVVQIGNKLYRFNNNWSEVINVITVAQVEKKPVVKELGWTPDTLLSYPAPEVYRYLVARLAEKFASLNESNIMGVQSELADARFAFQAFLKKDKSSWDRMRNVNLPTIGDWL